MRLRFVATLAPPVPGLARSNAGEIVSFLPLDRIWADSRFDPSHTIQFPGDVESYNPVREGDLLVPKVSPTFAHGRTAIACGLTGGRALATSEVFVLRPDDPRDAAFLRYRLISPDFLMEGRAAWQGVAGLKRVSGDFLMSTRIATRAWRNRHAIAAFLERECARANEVLGQHQAVRSAVLSSLWSPIDDLVRCAPTQRLKFWLQGIVDAEHATCPTFTDGTVPVVRTSDVRDGALRLDGALRTDEAGWRQWTRRRVPQTGDVVFTREAPIGEAAVVPPDTRLCIGQRSVLLLINRETVLPDLVVACLYSSPVRAEIELRGRSTTTAHLNIGEIGELPVPDLSSYAQEAVVGAVRRRREAVTQVVSVGVDLAKALAAYRSSLIHEAVTGKLDVTKVSDRQMDERLHAAAEDRTDEVAV